MPSVTPPPVPEWMQSSRLIPRRFKLRGKRDFHHFFQIPVLVDPKVPHVDAYRGATFITPNHHEAEAVTHMRIRSDEPVDSHDTVRFAMNNGRLDEACLLSGASWGWSLAAHNRKQRLTRLQAFELSAGEHVLKLAPRDSIYVDLIAVTDNPAMFD